MVETIPIPEDHICTTSSAERCDAIERLGYLDDGIVCHVPSQPSAYTLPLYRLHNPAIADHLYTTSATERDDAIRNLGYVDEGVACLVFRRTNDVARIHPLYRLHHAQNTDHLYTMSDDERDMAIRHLGFVFEGVAGYVYPVGHPNGIPLYRLYKGDAQSPHGEPEPVSAQA